MGQAEQNEWKLSIDNLDSRPLILRAKKHKILRVLLSGVVFSFVGIFATRQSGLLFAGLWFAILGALFCLGASAGMVRPPSLRLTAVGFEMISFVRTYKRSWNDIERFFLRRRARAPTSAAFNLKGRPQTTFQNFNRGFGGADGILPNIYELAPADMVALLEAAREHWSSRPMDNPNSTIPSV